jgi:hypothetical protein
MKDVAIHEENIEDSKEWEILVNYSDIKVKWSNIFINEGYENTLDDPAENGMYIIYFYILYIDIILLIYKFSQL